MKEFIVDVDVSSRILSRPQITSIVGLSGDVGWDRGDLTARGAVRNETACRFDSGISNSATIEQHMAAIVARWPAVATSQLRALDPDCSTYLRIAVLHDSFTTSFVLGLRWIRWAAECGLELEISAYPTSTENEKDDAN